MNKKENEKKIVIVIDRKEEKINYIKSEWVAVGVERRKKEQQQQKNKIVCGLEVISLFLVLWGRANNTFSWTSNL